MVGDKKINFVAFNQTATTRMNTGIKGNIFKNLRVVIMVENKKIKNV